jgi:hypothetical protein
MAARVEPLTIQPKTRYAAWGALVKGDDRLLRTNSEHRQEIDSFTGKSANMHPSADTQIKTGRSLSLPEAQHGGHQAERYR